MEVKTIWIVSAIELHVQLGVVCLPDHVSVLTCTAFRWAVCSCVGRTSQSIVRCIGVHRQSHRVNTSATKLRRVCMFHIAQSMANYMQS